MPDQTKASETPIPKNWLPILVGASLCFLVSILWWTLDQHEQANLQNKIHAEAQDLAAHIDADLRNRLPTLRHMARKWEFRESIPEEEFLSEANAYLAEVAGVHALEWVDNNFFIRWIVPLQDNEQKQNLPLAFEEQRRLALEKAKKNRSPTMTAPIDLKQGGKEFLICFPIYGREEFTGFIVAVFRSQEWLDSVLNVRRQRHDMSDDFRIAISMDDLPIFTPPEEENLQESGLSAIAEIETMEHRFSLHIWPTPAYIARSKTLLPKLTAAFGLLLSVLLASVVHLLQKTGTAKKALEAEIRDHQKTGEQVRLLLDSTAEAIYGIDLQGNCTFANQACARMLGYTSPEMLFGKNMHQLIHYSYPDGSPMDVADCRIYKAFREGQGSHVNDEVLWRANKTSFPAEYWSYPQIVNGEVTGAVVTFLDITDRREAEERLRESEQRFRSLVETTSDWVWEIDENGHYTYASPKVEELLGYRPEEVLGKSPFDFMPSEEAQRMKALFLEILKVRAPFSDLENRNHRKDGRLLILESSGVPVFSRDGVFTGYRGIDRDISKRKQAESRLAEEQQRLSYILEGTNVGTWEWNVQTGETIFNERWAGTIGYNLAELAPVSIETWIQFAHPDDLAASNDLLQRHFRKELPYYECEARMRHKNGDWVWVLDRGKVATWTEDGKPLMMCGTHQDITDRKLAEEEIRHLATHDLLTDLPSLRLAMDRLAMALKLGRRHKTFVAVMFIDLDGFKAVNDTLGHDAGDHVLREVAQRLLFLTRATDTVARVGGDEFLFIGTELHGKEDAAKIAEKMLHAVSRPIIFKGQQTGVGSSIGIALFPDHGDNMDQLIKLADKAMYQIKNTGKNSFAFATPQ